MTRIFLFLIIFGVLSACGGSSPEETAADDTPGFIAPVPQCSGFEEWSTSPYVLPYSVGEAYRLNQGNCSGFGHSGFWQYGYDFDMNIGTVVTAARGGVVLVAQDGASDGDRNNTNLITIEHPDGTVALYSHLTLNGVQVTPGQTVQQGDVIGLSGDTGNTGDFPHLHFSLHPCAQLPGLGGTDECPTLPITIRNTEPNPNGLVMGRTYLAEPF